MTPSVLLLHPPVTRPCEPPAGIARLAGALVAQGVPCCAVDLNLEALLDTLGSVRAPGDTWTLRAARHLSGHLSLLRSPGACSGLDPYRRAVADLERLLTKAGEPHGVAMGLTNYQERGRSPLRSADLLHAAEHPEKNPFFPFFLERLTTLLTTETPTLIGISLNYASQALSAFSLAGLVRGLCPGARILLGGGLVTSWMGGQGPWKNPFGGLIDRLVAGQGEDALLEEAAREGLHGRPPLPAYGAFPLASYFAPGPILPYSASWGCYWRRCAFCPERAEGSRWCPVPPAGVLQDLQALVTLRRPSLIHFLDNALTPRLLATLVHSPPGPPWYGFARFTHHLTDPDFCRGLRKAGCVMLQLGLESGDQEVLDRLEKGLDLSMASRALRTLHEAGVATYVYLLFGTPQEDETRARRTLHFAVTHHAWISFLNLALFNMPFHGPDAARYGVRPFSDADLSLYADFVHPSGWDRHRVRQFLDKIFRRHPALMPILRRDPPAFTSSHAPFFAMWGRGRARLQA